MYANTLLKLCIIWLCIIPWRHQQRKWRQHPPWQHCKHLTSSLPWLHSGSDVTRSHVIHWLAWCIWRCDVITCRCDVTSLGNMPVVVISRLWQMVRSHYTVPEVSILTRSSGKKLKFPPISLKWDRIAYQMCKVVCLDVFAGPSDRDVGNMNQNVLGVMIWCWVWMV